MPKRLIPITTRKQEIAFRFIEQALKQRTGYGVTWSSCGGTGGGGGGKGGFNKPTPPKWQTTNIINVLYLFPKNSAEASAISAIGGLQNVIFTRPCK